MEVYGRGGGGFPAFKRKVLRVEALRKKNPADFNLCEWLPLGIRYGARVFTIRNAAERARERLKGPRAPIFYDRPPMVGGIHTVSIITSFPDLAQSRAFTTSLIREIFHIPKLFPSRHFSQSAGKQPYAFLLHLSSSPHLPRLAGPVFPLIRLPYHGEHSTELCTRHPPRMQRFSGAKECRSLRLL